MTGQGCPEGDISRILNIIEFAHIQMVGHDHRCLLDVPSVVEGRSIWDYLLTVRASNTSFTSAPTLPSNFLRFVKGLPSLKL